MEKEKVTRQQKIASLKLLGIEQFGGLVMQDPCHCDSDMTTSSCH